MPYFISFRMCNCHSHSTTNLIDATGFSGNVNGSCVTCSIKNIHERTSYALRCFDQEKIPGRPEFLNVFNDGKPIIFLKRFL